MKASKLTGVLVSTAALCCATAFVAVAAPTANAISGRPPLLRVQAKSSDDTVRPAKPPEASSAGKAPAAGTATADDIVVTNGPATIHIKHIEVAGSSLSGTDLVALFASKDPKALEARLRQLDATSIVIPEITGESVDGTTEVHFTQKDVLLANVKSGRAETGSAAAATVRFKDGKNDTNVSTGATTLKGVDLAQIVHLATGPRTDDGEALRPICDEIVIHAATIGSIKNGPPVTVATIRETGLKGRPLKAASAAPAVDGRAKAMLDDVAHSFSAELIEADDFGLAGPASPSTNGLKSFALKHLAARGFGDGKLAHFEMNGLAAQGNDKQPGSLALASATIDEVATNATSMPSVDRIDLRDFSIDVPADDKEPTGQRMALAVAHAGYQAPGLVIGKLPSKATLSIEHATFDVPPDSGAGPMLLAMGYRHLDLSSLDMSRYDAAAQTLDLDQLSITGVGMGELDIKLGLAKVSEGIVSQDDAVQKAAAAAVLVKTFDLTLRNDGLIDKAIGFKAAIDGITVEEERTTLEQLVDNGLAGIGLQDSAKAQLVVAALHKFIAEPKTLHVALTSKDGLGSGAMPLIGNPQALLDALDVKANANE